MTFPDFSPWRKFSVKSSARPATIFLCALLVLGGCAADETDPGGQYNRPHRSLSGKFEWGVQYYEAGEYKEALKTFERLRKEGARVPEFDLVSYYIGMSHFRLGHFPEAASELEGFLRTGSQRQEAQDAKISLLHTYEELREWKKASSLAADTDKMTLFQNNRALLKLIWARALREQGELLGAKAVLEDALPYLDLLGLDENTSVSVYSDPDQDLWGRYHFTSLLVREMECNQMVPKEVPGKGKKAKGTYLYTPWLESVTDCLAKTIDVASEELFTRETPWAVPVEQSISNGIAVFAKKVEGYLAKEAPALDRHRALQKNVREQFYRLLTAVDENLKNFKKRGVTPSPLESFRKQIDRLLVTISGTS